MIMKLGENIKRGITLEASPEQRQQLIERLFKRSYLRRKFGMPPLDIDFAYAQGLNRILRKNLAQTSDGPILPTESSDAIACQIIYLTQRRGDQGHDEAASGE